MRKISVPINLNTITEENLPLYVESVKKCNAHRVFLIGFDPIHRDTSIIYTEKEKITHVVEEFKKVVNEVGFWISSFGHGGLLTVKNGETFDSRKFTPIEGVDGSIAKHGFCPTDKRLMKKLGDAIAELAKLNPDIIMLDDDFRLNCRSYYMGCFCPAHRKEYFKRIGGEVPREDLEKLIWGGGANKYRSEYMRLMGETIIEAAKEFRRRVDEVNPSIRLGSCTNFEAWDADGIDVMQIQNALKGKNKPFTRVCGAPYQDVNIICELENTRLQLEWLRDSDIEVMTEGDTHPRPRYNCPSKPLELFDILLVANNEDDHMLNYIYDYNNGPDYESGYVDRYLKNQKLREDVAEIFRGKTPTGVEVFHNMHILENFEFPENPEKFVTHRMLLGYYQSRSGKILSKNSIPTTYVNSDYPVLVTGEDGKYVELSKLKNGAILDAKAAKYLERRGVDVGLTDIESVSSQMEYYISENDSIINLGLKGLYALDTKDSAEILCKFMPKNSTSAYRYENSSKQRFLVFGYDAFVENGSRNENPSRNYFNNYYRQKQIIDNIPWLCGRKIPAVSFKNPNLYILASKKKDAMSVALANITLDDVLEPIVQLDREYNEIRFVNCEGRLEGDKVYLKDMTPYGFAAFEVK